MAIEERDREGRLRIFPMSINTRDCRLRSSRTWREVGDTRLSCPEEILISLDFRESLSVDCSWCKEIPIEFRLLRAIEHRLVSAKSALNLKTRLMIKTKYATLVCLNGPDTPIDALFISRNHHHPMIE